MSHPIRSLVCAAALLAVASPQLQAAPILGTLSSANSSLGVDTVTRDSASSLEWLDLRLSSAYSFNSIQAELGVSGLFAGFELATQAQVSQMLTNSGMLAVAAGAASQSAFDDFSLLFNAWVDDVGGLGCTLSINGLINDGGAPGLAGVGIDRQPANGQGCGPVQPGTEFITTGTVPVFLPWMPI